MFINESQIGRLQRLSIIWLSLALVFLIIMPKEAFCARSNAGGGELDDFDAGDVALNVGMSVGAAVAGQVVSSAWQAASPAVSATDMVFLEDMGYTMSKMDQMLYSAKNIFTSTEPWVQGFNSLTSISNVAPNIISGFNTYAAASQVGRAAAMAGAYYEWDAPTKFLVSSVAVGATGGFLNPEIALGIKDVAPLSGYDMAKGAFVGGIGAGAKAVIIYTIDKDEFGAAGYSPSSGAQIAGLVGGVAATNFGRAVMDSDTYHPKPMFSAERAKPVQYADIVNNDPEAYAWMDNQSTQTVLSGINADTDPEFSAWAANDKTGVFRSMPSGSQYEYNDIRNVDNGIITFGEKRRGFYADKFEQERLNSNIKINSVVPGVYEIIDRSAYVGADEALYRMFVKAPIIDTFSRTSWPGLAAESAGILVKDSLKDAQWAQRWVAPLLTEFTRSGAQTVFSSIANIGGLGLDLYAGSQNDLNKARLQYDYTVRNKGFEHYMDEKMPKFKDEKVKEIMDKTQELAGLSRDLEYLKREMLSDEEIAVYQEKEARRASLEQELGKDSITGKPFAILTSLNNKGEVIKELNAQGAYLPTEKTRQLEDEMTNLFNTNQNLVDLNRNLIITQEKMRVEKMMAVNDAGERISLTGALDVLGKNGGVETSRPGLIFDQVIFGLRSDAFQSLTKVAASVMVADMVEPKNDSLLTNIFQPYLANMAAATIRGIAWHYGWDYNSRNWQWHTKDINMSRFDYPEPEKYDKGFGQPGFDFIRYKFDQANYSDDMARWDRFNEFNNFNKTDGVGLIYHEERQKYEFGKGNVPDPRWVSHIVFLEEKPSLAYAIGRSLEQANMDFLSGAFSFGRPFVRSSIADASIGIEPAQVSSASFMSYISNLQNISGKGLVSAIHSNILDPDTGAIANSLSKTIGGTLLQVPYVPQIFHMQPERLVLTSTLRAQKQPVRVVTMKEEAKFAAFAVNGPSYSGGYVAGERVLEDSSRSDAYGKGGFKGEEAVTKDIFEKKSQTYQMSNGQIIELGQQDHFKRIEQYGVINEKGKEPDYWSNETFEPKPIINGLSDDRVVPPGPRVIPVDYNASEVEAASGVFDGRILSMLNAQRYTTTTVREGTQTYYFLTDLKAMPSTIQSLRYGGGGIPHANYVFLDPFPNPFYQPKPQTGPMTYLKANSNSKPEASSTPNATNSTFEGGQPFNPLPNPISPEEKTPAGTGKVTLVNSLVNSANEPASIEAFKDDKNNPSENNQEGTNVLKDANSVRSSEEIISTPSISEEQPFQNLENARPSLLDIQLDGAQRLALFIRLEKPEIFTTNASKEELSQALSDVQNIYGLRATTQKFADMYNKQNQYSEQGIDTIYLTAAEEKIKETLLMEGFLRYDDDKGRFYPTEGKDAVVMSIDDEARLHEFDHVMLLKNTAYMYDAATIYTYLDPALREAVKDRLSKNGYHQDVTGDDVETLTELSAFVNSGNQYFRHKLQDGYLKDYNPFDGYSYSKENGVANMYDKFQEARTERGELDQYLGRVINLDLREKQE